MESTNIKDIQKLLLKWFAKHQRKLPWRDTDNPYFIWVSEVMLQQTQVSTILAYYPKFIETFPTVDDLATADLQDVLKSWEGMGYYARARNLHKAAKIVVEEMDSQIPSDYQAFRRLPGVGDYIGAAVQSIAFNQPYAAVDGNVKRVLARIFLLDAPVNDSKTRKIFQDYADKLLVHDSAGTFNEAMMELGATVCRPRKPLCTICPIVNQCNAAKTARQFEFPVRRPSKRTPTYRIAVGVIQKEGQILITRRKSEGLLGGLWEFPGGKIEKSESAKMACQREIREEVNLTVTPTQKLTTIKHAYSHFRIEMDVFLCDYESGRVELNSPVDYRWITINQIDDFPFPKANHKFIPMLKKRMKLHAP